MPALVSGDPFDRVVAGASHKRRVVQNRVDHQLAAAVVIAEHETDRSVLVNHIAALDCNPRTVIGQLVADRSLEDDEVAGVIQRQLQLACFRRPSIPVTPSKFNRITLVSAPASTMKSYSS